MKKIMVLATITKFIGPEHLTDWPIFNDCNNSYQYVKAKSKAYKYCSENGIPYKIWK